ncbi:ABC transporter permease [Shewanella baltica]|jgi:ABC-2 type transport system permease protein|uniref:Transport permease protein n=4 Tax=Shewanella TaxID=22 RepID=A9L2A8_SHEB9|nr:MULTISPECIES: ABC transporter permease [Shewanella]EGT3628092.1 ABC transporter permease [Morganella morganii]ABN60251.1 ABC-2 type transporter [Shewanella baltica OS155]ABS09713.1 ABC-2 type transporter [Shewanella baltica OS185]ABX50871.1 ABC-2 type transporter [Shewanella baltica OS195]ACK48001.1 ABC-2 type transporter [Shewanella baltica OS223]
MNQLYFIAFKSILSKEINRFTRIWIQTLVPPAITMTLYFLIFGNLVGSRIGEMGGVSYMEFIAPGLIMMSVITNSYSNVASSFYSAKFQRNLEELMVAPVPHYVLIAGYVGGGVARGLCVGLIVTLVAMFFVDISLHHAGLVVMTVFLTSVLFSLGGLINAVFAKSFDDISIIPTFVLTPLTYLGGVFYSLSLLPPFWQGVSALNPVVYMINVFRYGFLGFADISVPLSIAIMIGFCVALWTLAYYLVSRGIGLRS